MRKLVFAGLSVLLLLGMMAIGVTAEEHDENHEELPPHAHMLVQRPELGLIMDDDGQVLGFGVVSVRKCVDLANHRAVPLHAHHANLHTGTAGAQLFEKANHAVVPTAPLSSWADCSEFEASLPFVFPDESGDDSEDDE